MEHEIFARMRQSIIDGAPQHAAELAREALALGLAPLDAVNDGFVPAMAFVGEQFGCRQMYLPDIMAAAEAMKAAMGVLEPEMRSRGVERRTLGTVVLGTVRGDIHEIGKNLVGTVLMASGFQVIDLGTNVRAEQFAQKAAELGADVVGVSSLLTTTMLAQREVVQAIDKRGLRPRVKVIVGGAPVTRKWADEIGADGYAPDAMRTLELVKALVTTHAAAAGVAQ